MTAPALAPPTPSVSPLSNPARPPSAARPSAPSPVAPIAPAAPPPPWEDEATAAPELKAGGPPAPLAGDAVAALAQLRERLANQPMHGWLNSFDAILVTGGGLQLTPKPGASGMVAYARTRLGWLGAELTRSMGRSVAVSLPAEAPSAESRAGGMLIGGVTKDRALAVPLIRDAMAVFSDAVLRAARPWSPDELPAQAAVSGDNPASGPGTVAASDADA